MGIVYQTTYLWVSTYTFQCFHQTRTVVPLPGRDDDGRKVILIRSAVHNPYQHKQDNVMKVS